MQGFTPHPQFRGVVNWLLVASFTLLGFSAQAALNDTGITTCSNAIQNGLPCPVEGFPGQDAKSAHDNSPVYVDLKKSSPLAAPTGNEGNGGEEALLKYSLPPKAKATIDTRQINLKNLVEAFHNNFETADCWHTFQEDNGGANWYILLPVDNYAVFSSNTPGSKAILWCDTRIDIPSDATNVALGFASYGNDDDDDSISALVSIDGDFEMHSFEHMGDPSSTPLDPYSYGLWYYTFDISNYTGQSILIGFEGTKNIGNYYSGVTMMSVTVTYDQPTPYILSISKTGNGSGTVTGSGIDCGATCNADFAKDSAITLIATPAANSTFAGWSGDADCNDGQITLDSNKSCTATFMLIEKPTVVTNAPSVVTATSARLSGTVNPNNADTTASFDWGKTTNYGANIAAIPSPIDPNAGPTNVYADLTGLSCNTPYNYRVNAENIAGVSYGGNQSFTTARCFTVTPLIGTGGGTVNPSAVQTVTLGSTTSFTVTPNPGYIINRVVSGTCPQGSWNGNVWTTGAIIAKCTVKFGFQPIKLDFTITGITLTPTPPVAGGNFDVAITVKNNKNANSAGDAGKLVIWTNQPTVQGCGAVGTKTVTVGMLAADEVKTITVTGLVATTSKNTNQTLRAFIDGDCGTVETNEANNQMTKTYKAR